MTERSKFSLGVQAGDTSSDEAVRPFYMEIRKLLETTLNGSYSRDISNFGLVLRIDGALWHWDRKGIGYVRVARKTGSATADIFMPISVWKAGEVQIRSYLADNLIAAYEAIADRMWKNRLDLDRDRLLADVTRATEQLRQ